MKAQRFKIGQEVVCIKKDQWRGNVTREPHIGPAFNETVHVHSYKWIEDHWSIFLCEYINLNPYPYNEKNFVEILPTSAITSLLEEVTETLKQEI